MKNLYFLMLLAFAAVSCSESTKKESKQEEPDFIPEWYQTESGLYYRVLREGEGKQVQAGDVVIYHYTFGLPGSDKVIDDSYKRNKPEATGVGNTVDGIPGLSEGLMLSRVGDIIELNIPPKLGLGDKVMAGVPPNSSLYYKLEILGTKEQSKAWDITDKAMQVGMMGMQYYIIEEKEGEFIMPGDRVKVHYQGFLTDGRKFDSSYDRGEPLEIVIGQGQVIRGWEIALTQMREGEKVKYIIPYSLAYGEPGYRTIPPRADLIFDMEVVEVIKPE